MKPKNSFNTESNLTINNTKYVYFDLNILAEKLDLNSNIDFADISLLNFFSILHFILFIGPKNFKIEIRMFF